MSFGSGAFARSCDDLTPYTQVFRLLPSSVKRWEPHRTHLDDFGYQSAPHPAYWRERDWQPIHRFHRG